MSINWIGKLSVFPRLPKEIERLQELAYNLWWSWNPDAQELYASIDPELWKRSNQNPVKFLREVSQQQIAQAAQDPDYLSRYRAVFAAFDAYMDPQADTWFRRTFPDKQEQVIAYFSAEFGLHESLPIYSGGLGILSGDHCKEASDLGLPFVGMGFLYPQGYFTQRINANGDQEAIYEKIDFAEEPVTPALDPEGKEVLIQVNLPGRTVYAKIWKIQVGRVPVYLMDTDVERNAPQDRELSARLYGGDHEIRISQEYILGIGGVRALRALGYDPKVWHMNEGHSAFLGLERVRELVQEQGLSFDEAVEAARASALFTTHTPVPAGHDAFGFELVEKFFWQFWTQLGISREQFLALASHDQGWGPQFSMTVLAFRLSAYHNGVSELHGHVSRRMWADLWPDTPVEQVPIGHITNGVHTGSWLAPELRALYDRYLPSDWLEEVDSPHVWENVAEIPDQELWDVHERQRKGQLVAFVRERIQQQYRRHGEGPLRLERADTVLHPQALTIGFARRFATYKRATLFFHDLERAKRILNDPERPVQIIFSGKAHPKDEPGKALIRQIYQLSQQPDFEGKVLFLENYDMNIARHLVAGVDIWLNNPRRPYEASGTSGQKAALSGVPNFSVLDGWWPEAYDGSNGWAIGEEREYKDQQTQDEADALSLYSTLEEEIIPLFFQRDEEGIPRAWIQRMRNSIRTCAPRFSTRRMVKEYTTTYYMPAAETGARYAADHFALAREMAAWKARVRAHWGSVQLQVEGELPSQTVVGEPVEVTARLLPGNLQPSELAVEIVIGHLDQEGILQDPLAIPMECSPDSGGGLVCCGAFVAEDSGQLTVGVRARPHHPALIHPYEMGLNRWA